MGCRGGRKRGGVSTVHMQLLGVVSLLQVERERERERRWGGHGVMGLVLNESKTFQI